MKVYGAKNGMVTKGGWGKYGISSNHIRPYTLITWEWLGKLEPKWMDWIGIGWKSPLGKHH